MDAIVDQAYTQTLAESASFRQKWAQRPTIFARTKLYRLLGVDPMDEVRLDHSPVTPVALTGPYADNAQLAWNLGSDGVGRLVEFQVFYDILQTDPSIQEWFKHIRPLVDGTHWAAFEATADEIVAMSELRTGIGAQIKQLDRRRYELVGQGAAPGEIGEVDAELGVLWDAKHAARDYFSNGLFPFLHFNIFAPTLEDEYTVYVPMPGEGHKAAFCSYLTQRALES